MKVSLFITCLSDVFFPEVGKSMVKILESLDVDVDFPMAQTCCGQPAYNSGYHKEAKEAAQHMIEVFADSAYVVSPSGSCTAMIRHEYPKMFADDPVWKQKAVDLAEKCYEFSEFIVNVLQVDQLPAAYDGKATYHHSCHMSRGLQVKEAPLKLLSSVKGLTLEALPYSHDCCGFGGTFAVKMAEISEAMVDEKVDHIIETGADILCGSDMACLMNIAGRVRRRGEPIEVMHTAQLLAKGLNRDE